MEWMGVEGETRRKGGGGNQNRSKIRKWKGLWKYVVH